MQKRGRDFRSDKARLLGEDSTLLPNEGKKGSQREQTEWLIQCKKVEKLEIGRRD